MDYRQLKAFIAVFEERNITSAARRLCLTQPALSAIIKGLEEELSTQLFERLPRGVSVTEEARILYFHARRMVADMEVLLHSFQKERARIPLHIGIEEDIALRQIEHFVRQVHHSDAHLVLTLESGCMGDVRLGCEESRCEDELFLPLFDESYVLVLPADHPLSDAESVSCEDLHSLSWVMCPQHTSHQRLLPIYGAMANSPGANAGTFKLALNLVSVGLGVAMVPQSLALEAAGVVLKVLSDYQITRRTGLCYALQSLELSAVAQLLKRLKNQDRGTISPLVQGKIAYNF
ncbi:MAG: LysR family transcriptional regulator [Enterobacteriaceae bacterium]